MSKRKNETREEYNKRQKLIRANRTPEQKEKVKLEAKLRMRNTRLTWTDEDRMNATIKERERRNKAYVVYKHSNDKGEVYYGSGNALRPMDFKKRKSNWFNAFPTPPNIEIMGTFKHRDIALLYEAILIKLHGLNNLVNVLQPKAIYKPF